MKHFPAIMALFFSLFLWAMPDDDPTLPENFHFTTLDNGLEILVIEDSSVPLVTIEFVVRNGSYTESPEFDGLSHLYEHMFFKANKDYPSQEAFMQRVNELGVSFNGTTSNERVNYYITLGSHNLENGLEFMNSAMRYPMFLEEEMKKENVVVDGEFERLESNPFYYLYSPIYKEVYGDLYSRKNPIGDHDVIRNATPAQMKTIQEKYYHPNNTLLAVAGDVKPEDVVKLAEGILGDWKASDFDPFERYPVPEFHSLTENKELIVENENQNVPVFMRVYNGPETRKDLKSTYAADIFSTILAQKTSKFYKEMVEGGYALQANVSYSTCAYAGPISLILVPNADKMEEALQKLNEEINKWDSDDYFTDEQMENAKKKMAIDDAFSQEKTSDFVHTVTYWWASASIPYYTDYVKNLNAVTREDIKKYVRTYIKDKNHVTGLLLKKELREAEAVDKFFGSSK